MLTGTNLFLAASIGSSPEFDNATDVPPDFTGTQLSVPRPVNGTLYLRLRDDPTTVQTLTLAVLPPVAGGGQTAVQTTQATGTPRQPSAGAATPAAAVEKQGP
jgi:hypothetical protein